MYTNLSLQTGKKIKTEDLILIGLLSATVTAGKLALSFIPNVEIVTLLLLIYTVSLGVKRGLLITLIFTTTEIFIYGFSTWVLAYYFVWPLLIIIIGLFKRQIKTEYGFAFIAGIFGLTFGFLFAIFESFFYGYAYGIAYWIRGIPFDIVHGVSNYIVVIILYKPLTKVFKNKINDWDLRSR
jgi:energy-coupling factor transport system substrate-specific component